MSIGFIKFFVSEGQYVVRILCSVTNYIRIMMGMAAYQKSCGDDHSFLQLKWLPTIRSVK